MALNTRLTYKNKEVQHCSIQIYRDQIVPQYFAEDQLKKQTHTHTHTHAHAHTHTHTCVTKANVCTQRQFRERRTHRVEQTHDRNGLLGHQRSLVDVDCVQTTAALRPQLNHRLVVQRVDSAQDHLCSRHVLSTSRLIVAQNDSSSWCVRMKVGRRGKLQYVQRHSCFVSNTGN